MQALSSILNVAVIWSNRRCQPRNSLKSLRTEQYLVLESVASRPRTLLLYPLDSARASSSSTVAFRFAMMVEKTAHWGERRGEKKRGSARRW